MSTFRKVHVTCMVAGKQDKREDISYNEHK